MTATYCFGRFELNPATRQLLADGQPVVLGARAFDVLLALLERRERLVTKDELLDLAWPGLVVEESNLHVQVSALRKILGDQAIKTLPGRGYRFTAEVRRSATRGSTEPERHNLPRPLTRFIGHEADLDEYSRIITTNRLVTLTGIGGCGKTRLALELARRVLPRFAHGAWVVDLAPMADPERLPLTVARTLGVHERPGDPIVDTLCECVAGWQILLVLDNCEHLVSACAALVQTMLGAARDLTVLATSREALDVPGECTLRVRSLSYADPGQRDSPNGQTYEAVELFVDRARLVQPNLALDATTAPAINEICRRLDGIPLAIELAAARTKVLSVDELRQKLDDRFRLLVGGSRVTPPRQQTLLAAIKWSFDVLTSEERVLLEGLSVFSGGWTLEAAVALGGADAGHYDVLEQLTHLVNKSLVAARTGGRATRYSMLETVRQYALERLQEGGDEAQWRERHLAYFLEFSERAAPHLIGPEQTAWFDQLEAEHENLNAALRWSASADGNAVSGLRLATALWRFWRVRGYHTEGRAAFAAILAVAPEREIRTMLPEALWGLGTLTYYQGDLAAAEQIFERDLALCRELGDHNGLANALFGLGYVAEDRRDFDRCRSLREEALAIRRELGDRPGVAKALGALGTLASNFGDHLGARARHEESLAIQREVGDRDGAAHTLINLGLITEELGDLPRAVELVREGLGICRELNDRQYVAAALLTLASFALAMRKPSEAVRLWGAGDRLLDEIGYVIPPEERSRRDRGLDVARSALGDTAYEQAWQEGLAMTWEEAAQYALDRHGV